MRGIYSLLINQIITTHNPRPHLIHRKQRVGINLAAGGDVPVPDDIAKRGNVFEQTSEQRFQCNDLLRRIIHPEAWTVLFGAHEFDIECRNLVVLFEPGDSMVRPGLRHPSDIDQLDADAEIIHVVAAMIGTPARVARAPVQRNLLLDEAVPLDHKVHRSAGRRAA